MKTQQVSTGALIARRDKKFLILKRSAKEDFLPGHWEIPGGGSDYGETPEETVKREIKEECGVDILVKAPLSIGNYFMGEIQRVEINFLCVLADENAKIKTSEEHEEQAWISSQELEKYQMSEYMRGVLVSAVENMDYWFKKYL
jgi:8-oxo-dGTP diphosphatase